FGINVAVVFHVLGAVLDVLRVEKSRDRDEAGNDGTNGGFRIHNESSAGNPADVGQEGTGLRPGAARRKAKCFLRFGLFDSARSPKFFERFPPPEKRKKKPPVL